MHYDMDGNPISLMHWAKLFENTDGRRIGYTKLPQGGHVSTVWLGIDHSFGGSVPLIFETIVFDADTTNENDMERYSTRAQAEAGHKAMVEKWMAKEAV